MCRARNNVGHPCSIHFHGNTEQLVRLGSSAMHSQHHRTSDLKTATDYAKALVVIAGTVGVGQATPGSGRALGAAGVEAVVVIHAKVLGEVAVKQALLLARTHNLEHTVDLILFGSSCLSLRHHARQNLCHARIQQ